MREQKDWITQFTITLASRMLFVSFETYDIFKKKLHNISKWLGTPKCAGKVSAIEALFNQGFL